MESFKFIYDGALVFVGLAWSYLMYSHKKSVKDRQEFEREVRRDIRRLNDEYHRLDRSQAEIAVEIKEIKSDIGYIRKGLDTIIEKL